MPTHIPAGHPLAKKVFGAALFAKTVKKPGFMNNLTGPAPKQAAAEKKLKGQTSPDMPFVRVTDLAKSKGDTIQVDMFDIIHGKPIAGERNAEGKGKKLSSSSMDVKIDLLTQVVDLGGKMTNQRSTHNLRGIGLANLTNYMERLESQMSLVHVAGARGAFNSIDWAVPLQNDADFIDIMINDVKAPTYNRHFVADGANLVQGGQQLGSIDSTDVLTLDHLDWLSTMMDESEYKLQPIKVADDPAANDEPMYALYISPRQWHAIKTATGDKAWRTFLQNAWNRASYGSKHPLFKGECGMWGNILMRKNDRPIRFGSSDSTNIVSAANRYTATESAQVVNAALGATAAVDRAILLGAQAMANVYGKNQSSDYYTSWLERTYNFDRDTEVAADTMGGKAKLRFDYVTEDGNKEPTDHGVVILDTAVNL